MHYEWEIIGGNICQNIPHKVEEGIFEKGEYMNKLLLSFKIRYILHSDMCQILFQCWAYDSEPICFHGTYFLVR